MSNDSRILACATDTTLAGIYDRLWAARDAYGRAIDSLHRAARDELTWARSGRGKAWKASDQECLERLRARLDSDEFDPNRRYHEGVLAAYLGGPAAIAAIEAEMVPHEALYRKHRWSRFFLVTNSNGHIHSSMSCSTCERTTRYAWLPDLSGLTEADAVAAKGPKLCSVCFPSAPVEWTLGNPKAARCPGSNTFVPNPGHRKYLVCPVCGTSQVQTASGLRAHKPRP